MDSRPRFPCTPISGRIAVKEARFRRRLARAGRSPISGLKNEAPARRLAPKTDAAAGEQNSPDFLRNPDFPKSVFLGKYGQSAAISAHPDFGPNRGKGCPVSATSGPGRPEPHFGAQKRGASKAINAETRRRGRRAEFPRFPENSGFPEI